MVWHKQLVMLRMVSLWSQTAEGGLSETHSILNRMRDLTVQASNETNSESDLTAISSEMTELGNEIDRIAKTTKFNEKSLLDTETKTFKLQIGSNTAAEDTLTVTINKMDKAGLGIGTWASITDITSANTNAKANIDLIDSAIKEVSAQRTTLGASQNRLEHTINNLSILQKRKLSEANSRITDVDMAEEMSSFTKSNILAQAATSMLAQANQMPQSVLSLLQ